MGGGASARKAQAADGQAGTETVAVRAAKRYPIVWQSKVKVPTEYQHQSCHVPETHRRAMKFQNFQRLGELIEQVLAKHEHVDRYNGMFVTTENVNLYHINELFVLPLTEAPACSFMEMVSDGPQDPQWFISHWWGTPFFDTLRMMALHGHHRQVGPEGCYWMCTFANNQHNLAELSEPSLLQTPFAEAIMNPACLGTVAFLDEEKASPFSRIWCILEDYVTIHHGGQKEKGQLLDFCTIIPEAECERSDGTFNERCAGMLLDNGDGTTTDVGSDLEEAESAWFPGGVSLHALRLDVTKAQASVDSDRVNILRLIRGKEAEVNTTIQKMFAASAAYMAVTAIACEEETNEQLLKIVNSGLLGSKDEWPLKLDKEGCVADCAEYDARCKGNMSCLQYMLEAKCDANHLSAEGRHPLELAFEVRGWPAVRMLLKHGADPNQVSGGVSKKGLPDDITQMLVEAGFEFKKRGRHRS